MYSEIGLMGKSSRYAANVGLRQYSEAGQEAMYPDNRWDFVVFRRRGRYSVLRTGFTTRPDIVPHEEGDEILTISFRPDCYMPTMLGDRMKNTAVFLDCGSKKFWLGSDAFEIPTFGNADVFVERLAKKRLVECNPLVESILKRESLNISERTAQRQFLRTTGLTFKHFSMIGRAQKAISLLQTGQRSVDVAFALGYSDQPHMINSLRQIMGNTPSRLLENA
jgi:hypothetical protein